MEPQIYTADYEIDGRVYEHYLGFLSGNVKWDGTNETMYSVVFPEGYSINVNLVDGGDKLFVEAILYQNSDEMYTWEYGDTIYGCWECVFGGEIQRAFRLESYAI